MGSRCGIFKICVVERRGRGGWLAGDLQTARAGGEEVLRRSRVREGRESRGLESRRRRCSLGGCEGVDSARPSCAAEGSRLSGGEAGAGTGEEGDPSNHVHGHRLPLKRSVPREEMSDNGHRNSSPSFYEISKSY
jgi:hypothetical protein